MRKMSRAKKPDKKRRLIAAGLFFFLLLALSIEIYENIQLEYWFGVISLSLVGLQGLIAGWIYYDVNKQGTDTKIYIAAFVIPFIGILTLPIYIFFIRNSKTGAEKE